MRKTKNKKIIFIVWNPFQRRAQSLSNTLDLDIHFFHYPWEEKSKVHKALAYIRKFIGTLAVLTRDKPEYVVIQLAPTPLLYAAALYCSLSGAHYISDCHNTMIYDAHWIKWPLAKYLLRRSHVMIVHNTDVKKEADLLGLPSRILRDPLPVMEFDDSIDDVAGIKIKCIDYIIVPCSMAEDEPVEELFSAASSQPDVPVVFTWFSSKLPENMRASVPDNIIFTGFLDEPLFNALYANAAAALVLTTREGTQPSGASEAIALGVPLIVSDIKTTRRLYADAPVYVDNTAESISDGIMSALASHQELAGKIAGLRERLQADASAQIGSIRELISRTE